MQQVFKNDERESTVVYVALLKNLELCCKSFPEKAESLISLVCLRVVHEK